MVHLASAVALLILGGRFDVDVGVAGEGRAGVTPIQTGSAGQLSSKPSAAGIVTPTGELSYETPRLVTRLIYGLRIFEGVTRDIPVQQSTPLFLHNVNLSLLARLGHRFDASVVGNLSYGEADYSYYSVLAPTQASLPPPQKFLSLSLGVVTHLRLTRLWTLQTTADVLDRRPIDAPATTPGLDTTPVLSFPHQRSLDVMPSLIGRVTRRDDVIVAIGAVYQATDGQPVLPGAVVAGPQGAVELFSLTPNLGWRARLSRGYDFHVAAGLAYNYLIEKPPNFPAIWPVAPTGALDLTVHLVTRREMTLRGTFGATLDYYLDPILGASGPRGTAFAHLTAFLPMDWTAGFDASFSSLLTSNPYGTVNGVALINPDQTVLVLTIPVRHRMSRNFTAEMGLRYTDRGPTLWSSDFSFHAHEAWLYLMLTATSRAVPDYRPL